MSLRIPRWESIHRFFQVCIFMKKQLALLKLSRRVGTNRKKTKFIKRNKALDSSSFTDSFRIKHRVRFAQFSIRFNRDTKQGRDSRSDPEIGHGMARCFYVVHLWSENLAIRPGQQRRTFVTGNSVATGGLAPQVTR